jgi:hypothetical protein
LRSIGRSPEERSMHLADQGISRQLTVALSSLAAAALNNPIACDQTYSCRRLLWEAASRKPLCRDAARTVIDIAADILTQAEARDDRRYS